MSPQKKHIKCLNHSLKTNLRFVDSTGLPTPRHTCRRQGLAVMVLVGYVLLVALGGLVAGLECKNGALEMMDEVDEVGVGLFEQFLTKRGHWLG